MMINLLIFAFGAIALLIAFVIVLRHWKELRMLNPLSIKEEQTRQKREAVIRRRFEERAAHRLEPFKRFARRTKQTITRSYEKTYERLQNFETFYRNMKSPFAVMAPTTRDRLKTLLDE
ncbi:hypothetical protein EXS71_04275, partial [Candidatus Uhrbacteria bacterium]|nr:hypothetical protein [Candidatus Uhrbacteria bacterium]